MYVIRLNMIDPSSACWCDATRERLTSLMICATVPAPNVPNGVLTVGRLSPNMPASCPVPGTMPIKTVYPMARRCCSANTRLSMRSISATVI